MKTTLEDHQPARGRPDRLPLSLIGAAWPQRSGLGFCHSFWVVAIALMGSLMAASRADAQEYFDNVVIVLDASGSMKQILSGTGVTKMDAAKTALKTVLTKVPASTQVGLIVFGAANQREDWLYPLGPRNDGVLTAAIDRIEPAAGTPLGEYIKKGADRLLEARAKQFGYGSYRLLVVTDGQAQDPNLVNRYTPDVMSRGITMDVIGVGMKQDHTLATRVHSYRRANDPKALSRAITEVFAEIGGSAQDLTQAEVFEMLAPIPTEVAAAMIQALATSGNHPIGSRPRAAAPAGGSGPGSKPSASSGAPSTTPSQPTPPTASAAPTAPHSHSTPTKSSRRNKIPVWIMVVVVLVIAARLGRARRKARR